MKVVAVLVFVMMTILGIAILYATNPPAHAAGYTAPGYTVSYVIDGDTIVVKANAKPIPWHVRLVQVDTPEIFFDAECFGEQASLRLKELLPPGTKVRLTNEPAAGNVDRFERLLRYVIRAEDGLNVNVRLVAEGVATPFFYQRQRGYLAPKLELLAQKARKQRLGLWAACPHTVYDPYRAVETER